MPEFDLRHLLATLRGQLVPILVILTIAALLGAIWTMFQTPKYTSAVSLQIDDLAGQVLESGDEVQASSSDYDVDRFLNTQLDVIQSYAVSEKVVETLKLADDQQFLGAMMIDPATMPDDPRQKKVIAVSALRSAMIVSLPRQSRIATLAVVSADPVMSAKLADGYGAAIIETNLERKFDSTAYARDFVAEQLAEAKERLELSEGELNAYARQAGLIRLRGDESSESGGTETSITTSSLVQMNQAAIDARTKRIETEGRWRVVAASDPMNSREVMSNATVQNLLTRRADIQAQLEDERTRHLAEHPNVQRLEAQLAVINRQIAGIVSGVRKGVESEYRSALENEQALNRQVAAMKGDTLGEQDRSVQYNLLQREADTNRALYDGLLQRFQELTAAAGVSSSNIALIDKAQVQNAPSSPNLILNILYALFVGLFAAALYVFVKLQLDDAVRTPENVDTMLGLRTLGIIPYAGTENIVEELSDPKSSVAESYNSLRGAIGFAADGKVSPLLVTSVSPSEGKSTSSYALTRGFGRIRGKVVLVDTDMRRPSTHKLLGLKNETGLSSVLSGNADLADALQKLDDSNIWVITSGPIPDSPSELLAADTMGQLLAQLDHDFDMVVLDSAPILGLADAPLLSSLVSTTLVVIESGLNGRKAVHESLRRVRQARGNIIGAVLTKFDPAHSSNYGGSYGRDYYTYGDGSKPARNPVKTWLGSQIGGQSSKRQ
ncbi:polysaccharide biosynthesis tyrosine autokinase [Altererythrobacter aquiaggeris]|uniref:GumC family protein n=1 Tax=Aestuarierythrobacter aquiaggeris TaxID=1898396 RepID=UPI003018E3BB